MNALWGGFGFREGRLIYGLYTLNQDWPFIKYLAEITNGFKEDDSRELLTVWAMPMFRGSNTNTTWTQSIFMYTFWATKQQPAMRPAPGVGGFGNIFFDENNPTHY
jgi:hypothetical protein